MIRRRSPFPHRAVDGGASHGPVARAADAGAAAWKRSAVRQIAQTLIVRHHEDDVGFLIGANVGLGGKELLAEDDGSNKMNLYLDDDSAFPQVIHKS